MKTIFAIFLFCCLILVSPLSWAIEGPQEEEKPFFLRELLVTATRTPLTIEDVPASSSIINEEKIKATNPRDLGEALRGALGVDIRSQGPLGSVASPSLRASTPQQVLVLVDGRPMNIPSLGQADLSTIPVSAIDRIEVVRGPGSNLYGANALGGVINVITKDPDKLTFRATGAFSVYTHPQFLEDKSLYTRDRHYGDLLNVYAEHGLSTAALGLPTDYGNFGYYVTIDHRNTSGYRDNSDFEGNDVTVKLKYDYKNLFIARFLFNFHGNELGVPGSKPGPDVNPRSVGSYGNRQVFALFDRQEDQNFFWDFTTEIHPHKTLTLRTRLFRNDFDNRFLSIFDDFNFFPAPKTENKFRTVNATLGGGLQADWDPATWFSASAGIEGKVNDFSSQSREINFFTKKEISQNRLEASENTMGYWLQLRLTPIKQLILQSGVRFDHHSVFHSQFGVEASPNWGLVWKINDWNILKVNVGRAYRTPTLSDRFFKDPFFVANPGIGPERGWSGEVGYELGLDPLLRLFALTRDSHLWVRLGSYYREVKDLIQSGPFAAGGKFTPENLGWVRVVGAEAEVRAEFLKYFTLGANYAYTNALQNKLEVTGARFVFFPTFQQISTFGNRQRAAVLVPLHRGGFFGLFDSKHPLYWTRLALEGQMAAERPFYFQSFNQVGGPFSSVFVVHAKKKVLPAFYTVNFKLTQGLGRFAEMFFAVDNMTNTAWRESIGFTYKDRDFPMPGRRFTAGVTVKYN